jgi:hypothetical protein
MIDEELCGIDLRDRVDGNVGSLVLESTMHIDISVNGPDCCAESLNGTELVPLTRLGVVDFKSNVFANLVCASTNDHHQRAEEESRVLIARSRSLTSFVRSLYPVPSSVTMASKTPGVA